MIILKILLLGVIGYFIWALIYHKKDKSLTFAFLMEYLLIAGLAIVILLGVLN